MSYEGNEATIKKAKDQSVPQSTQYEATNLVIPGYVYKDDSINIYKIVNIGSNSFDEYYSYAKLYGSLTLPDTVRTIANSAFSTRYHFGN